MNKFIVFIGFLVAGSLWYSCESGRVSISDFQKLEGNWTQGLDGISTLESWQRKGESYEGYAVEYRNLDTLFYEEMRIYQNDKENWVCAISVGKESRRHSVMFELQNLTDSSFTFFNSQNDFPKRIVYTFSERDKIHAYIDNGENDTENRVNFYYTRE